MEVYLSPVVTYRYELYCERPEVGAAEAAADARTGVFAGMMQRFRAALARVERERDLHPGGSPPASMDGWSWQQRMGERFLRWIAEAIAEQRLLWHLRRQTEVTAVFPEDMPGVAAMAEIRRMLQRDAERHLRWLIIDALLLCVTGIVAIVPGPNVLAYYFGFRVVGHYLSLRGARQGLSGVTWRERPCAPLADLRRVVELEPHARERDVDEIAGQLHLARLPSFFRRTAIPAA